MKKFDNEHFNRGKFKFFMILTSDKGDQYGLHIAADSIEEAALKYSKPSWCVDQHFNFRGLNR